MKCLELEPSPIKIIPNCYNVINNGNVFMEFRYRRNTLTVLPPNIMNKIIKIFRTSGLRAHFYVDTIAL